MSHEAIIKFAPIFTLERFNDPKWARPGRTMYEPGAFRFGPSEDPFVDKETVPLLIDHDPEREIGTVRDLWKWGWIDGPWVFASATLTDVPPWLERGTRVSFGFSSLQTHRDSRLAGAGRRQGHRERGLRALTGQAAC
jgi:hypothetical protein